MKKNEYRLDIHRLNGYLKIILITGLIAVLLAACSGSSTPTSVPAGATAAPTTASPIHLVIWWWGEQEAPGAQKFMDETVKLYEAAHPNVTIETVLQSTDNLIPSFQSAIAAGSGPDIEYVWGGIFTLDFVWSEGLRSVDDLIPADELSHYINNFERTYDGKVWGVPWYLSGNPLVYNTTLFAQAGVDPTKLQTWDDLTAACTKLRAQNIVPISGGFKDGWYGGWLGSIIGRQPLDSEKDFIKATIGQAKFTDPPYAAWWTAMQKLNDAHCWNDDAMSLDQYQGLDLFTQGKSAMVIGNDTFIGSWIQKMGADKIGVLLVPKFANGKLADDYVVTAQALAITKWSKNPQEAANFLMYMHTPDRLKAWFADTGVLPADNRMDTSLITQAQVKQIYKWDTTVAGPNLENFVSVQVDQEGWWTGVQDIISGNKTPEEAAASIEAVAQKYRDQNPDALKNWTAWMK